MNRIKLYTLLLLSLSTFACDKFLDINPAAEVVNEDMFSNPQGCEDAVYGLYGKIKTSSLYGGDLSWNVTEILAQNLDASTLLGKGLEYQNLGKYKYKDAKTVIDAMWVSAYEIIGHANNAITNLEKRATSFPLYNIYLGESYGIRALLHFDMLRLFAPHVSLYGAEQGIPYVTKYTFKHTPFSSVEKCYEYVISDLKKAQSLLVEDKSYIKYPRQTSNNYNKEFLRGRELHFNYYAATALLARVYWTKGDLVNAKIEALKVIESGTFPLSSKDEVQNMIAGALSPKESIYGIYSLEYFDKVKTYHHSSRTGSLPPFRGTGNNAAPLTYNTVYAKDLGANAGSDSRLRWFATFTASEGERGFMCQKLLDRARVNSESSTPASRNLYEGISVLRSVEMYYIVAEAFLAEGNTSEATKYFNEVLASRGLTKLENRQPAIVLNNDVINNERHKEFFCEGQRWFDMKRLNADIISNTERKIIPASNEIYVLPITDDEFDYRVE